MSTTEQSIYSTLLHYNNVGRARIQTRLTFTCLVFLDIYPSTVEYSIHTPLAALPSSGGGDKDYSISSHQITLQQ